MITDNVKKIKALIILRDAVVELFPDEDPPRITEAEYDHPILVWEGIYEWAVCVTIGSSILAGESGNYSTPLQANLQAAVEKIKAMGVNLEADSSWAVSAWGV